MMLKIVAGSLGFAVVLGVIGGLTTDPSGRQHLASPPAVSAEDLRAHQHRMQSAELMINRLSEKFDRALKICDQPEFQRIGISGQCKGDVLKALPLLTTIREVASGGDPSHWATVVNIAHKLEADIEGPMNDLRRR